MFYFIQCCTTKDHILKDGDTVVFGGAALDKVEHGQPVSNWPLAVTYIFKEVKNIPVATSIVSDANGSSRIDTSNFGSSSTIPAAHRVYTPTISYNNSSGTKKALPHPIEKIISIVYSITLLVRPLSLFLDSFVGGILTMLWKIREPIERKIRPLPSPLKFFLLLVITTMITGCFLFISMIGILFFPVTFVLACMTLFFA